MSWIQAFELFFTMLPGHNGVSDPSFGFDIKVFRALVHVSRDSIHVEVVYYERVVHLSSLLHHPFRAQGKHLEIGNRWTWSRSPLRWHVLCGYNGMISIITIQPLKKTRTTIATSYPCRLKTSNKQEKGRVYQDFLPLLLWRAVASGMIMTKCICIC